jgi:hypothetical protein
MVKKAFLGVLLLVLAYAIVSIPSTILAKNGDVVYVLPENEGVYDVPGNPSLKLKVFVYREKDKAIEKSVKGGKVQSHVPLEVCKETSLVDLDSQSVVSVAGWKLPSNWVYQVNSSSIPVTIGSSRANSLIANAYAEWQGVLGSGSNFSRGLDTTKSAAKLDGQNIVSWGRASSTALAVTYTWYNSVTGYAVEIDTIMNNRFTWYWSDPASWNDEQTCAYQGVYDAQNILTHELGHTVGLDDEYTSEFVNNTMYGYGSTGETKKNTLTSGDIFGLDSVY